MKKYLIIIGALGSLITFAQDLPNVVPPSPEAQAFQKYGDIPVSYYTGVPNISIPLYSINEGDISVPISLSYHASGIKVAEEASRVGLGWVLNAGGVISRTVVGRDDFSQIASYHNGGIPTLNLGSQYVFPQYNLAMEGDNINLYNNTSPLNLNTSFIDPIGEVYDFEPDQYSYNFMGYSGQFILTPNKEVILAKNEKIKIQCMDANAGSWEIWTPDGMHFYFEEVEEYLDASSNMFIKSSWYLNKIVSPNGNQIDFLYDDLGNQYVRPLGYLQEIDTRQYATASGGANCGGPYGSFNPVPVAGKEYKQKRLNSIIADLGTIDIIYGTREDLDGDSKIERIEIFKKENNIKSANPIKRFEFVHDYFQTNVNGQFNNTSESKKRLRLSSLLEYGFDSSNAIPLSPYLFEYESNINLPSKTSLSRDHWGYYNGKGNSSLIPSFSTLQQSFTVEGLIGVMGTERDPSSNSMKAGSLKKITYPTGGSTEFFYESNEFDPQESNANIASYSQPYTDETNQFTYDNKGTLEEGYLDFTDMYINPETGLPVPTEFTVKFRTSNGCNPNSSGYGNEFSYYELYDDNNVLIHRITIGSPNVSCDGYFWVYNSSSGINEITLNQGTYRWVAYMPNVSDLQDLQVHYSYKGIFTPNENGIKYYNAGGLRIKKIVDKDNINPENDRIKEFFYNYTDDVNADGIDEEYSYGVLKSYPRYSYFDPQEINGCFVTFLVRTSNSTVPLGSFPVGYSQVTVSEQGNGKTIYKYHNKPNVNLNYNWYSHPYGMDVPVRPTYKPLIEDRFAGLLDEQINFKESNGLFTKIREVKNLYDVQGAHNFNNLYYGIELRRDFTGSTWSNNYDVAHVYPAMISNFVNIVETSEKLYSSEDINDFIVINTTFDYDYSSHLQLKNKTVTDSKGNEIISNFYYPDDVISISALGGPNLSTTEKAAIDALNSSNQHRVNEVVQSENIVKKSGIEISKSFTRKEYEVLNNNLVAISKVKTLKGDFDNSLNPYQDRIEYTRYDLSGNLLEVSKTYGNSVCYIWGYSKEYPVAKIQNIDYGIIENLPGFGVNFNLGDSGLSPSQETTLRTHPSMTGAMITTFSYNPLVGVTSVTDPRGETVFYEYDDHNRLKTVRDTESKLLKDYEYHYKGQN